MEKNTRPGLAEDLDAEVPDKNTKKEKKPKKPKKEKPVKKDSFIKRVFTTLILLVIIFVLTIVIFFGAVFVFNIGGRSLQSGVASTLVGYPIIGPIMKPIAANMTPSQLIEFEKNQALKIQKDFSDGLAKKEAELSKKSAELSTKEQGLIRRETDLLAAENEVKSLKESLNGSLNSYIEQAAYFDKMDATKAMNILVKMDSKETVVKILRNMTRNKAIAIVSLMDPLKAAHIMEGIAEIPVPTPITDLTPGISPKP